MYLFSHSLHVTCIVRNRFCAPIAKNRPSTNFSSHLYAILLETSNLFVTKSTALVSFILSPGFSWSIMNITKDLWSILFVVVKPS